MYCKVFRLLCCLIYCFYLLFSWVQLARSFVISFFEVLTDPTVSTSYETFYTPSIIPFFVVGLITCFIHWKDMDISLLYVHSLFAYNIHKYRYILLSLECLFSCPFSLSLSPTHILSLSLSLGLVCVCVFFFLFVRIFAVIFILLSYCANAVCTYMYNICREQHSLQESVYPYWRSIQVFDWCYDSCRSLP